jgi:hypothetical protein
MITPPGSVQYSTGGPKKCTLFPAVEVPEHAPTIITMEQQAKVLDAIPYERRGLFLCAATEALRLAELRGGSGGRASRGLHLAGVDRRTRDSTRAK